MKRIIILSTFSLLLSCKSTQSQSATDFIRANSSSHVVDNKAILELINKKKERIIKSDSLYNIIMIKIDSINPVKQDIYIKASNFQLEQGYCLLSSGCEKPSGYLTIDNIPILIYGNTDIFFKEVGKIKDILRTKSKVDIFEMEGEYSWYTHIKDTIYGDYYEDINYKGEVSDREVKSRLFN
jgi:hypothetical protein